MNWNPVFMIPGATGSLYMNTREIIGDAPPPAYPLPPKPQVTWIELTWIEYFHFIFNILNTIEKTLPKLDRNFWGLNEFVTSRGSMNLRHTVLTWITILHVLQSTDEQIQILTITIWVISWNMFPPISSSSVS